MHPTYDPRSARSAGVRRSSATTSETPRRPPGLRTRAISRQDGCLVGGEVDHAVRNHDVDRTCRQRDRFDRALEKDRVGRRRLRGVVSSEREHLVGHVEPVGVTRRADAFGGEDHVDSAAGAEVEHRFAFIDLGTAVGFPQPSEASLAAVGRDRHAGRRRRVLRRTSLRHFHRMRSSFRRHSCLAFPRLRHALIRRIDAAPVRAAPLLWCSSATRSFQISDEGQLVCCLPSQGVVRPFTAFLAVNESGVEQLLHVV